MRDRGFGKGDSREDNRKRMREALSMAYKRIEYMCSQCGKKEMRFVSQGKPMPGKCPRSAGGTRPHRWTVNRKLE